MGLVFMNGDKYILTLKDPEVRERYKNKIKMCGNIDPFATRKSECTKKFQMLPTITMIDIILYLVDGNSYYTLKEFKAYKSFGAYKLFLNGWCQDLFLRKVPNEEKTLLLGSVKHSLKFNEVPLKSWILCKNDGSIITAHCNCTAGLGEVCSHVAAILFMVEYLVRLPDKTSVTDLKSKWPVPSCREILPSTLQGAARESGRMTYTINSSAGMGPPIFTVNDILTELVDKNHPAALARVVPPFNAKYVVPRHTVNEWDIEVKPEIITLLDNLVLPSYYNVSFEEKSLMELQSLGRILNQSISEEKVNYIEKITRLEMEKNGNRKDASRPFWHKFRSGRVTGSNFKDVCIGKCDKPSKTTLKKVCYSTDMKKVPKSIRYGWCNEVNAIKCFTASYELIHDSFEVQTCGLIISKENPIFASTPDSLCCCSCCGKAVIEAKCPYTLSEAGNIENFAQSPKSYLNVDSNGLYTLNKKHTYYYQCQLQMFTTKRDRCYFIVWTPREWTKIDVMKDDKFWALNSKKAEKYIFEAVYPELLGRFYSNKIADFFD